MAMLDLNEAAQVLGISPEQLNEMRERGEIRAFRDGANWKFKSEEVEAAKADGIDADSLGDDDVESILVDEPLPTGTTSTIIGKNDGVPNEDSDVQIGAESDIQIGGESDVLGGGSDDILAGGSSLKLSDPNESGLKLDSSGDSGLKLSEGSGGSELNLSDGLDTGTGSDLKLSDGLDTGTGSDLSLEGAGTGDLELASDLSLGSDDLDLGDDLELGDDDDDGELLLGSGSGGSDITLGAADTGINLTSPSDSGLSLEEEPLELGSSVSSLELPEDDDDDMISAGGAPLQKDDEFMLSQPDEMGDDDDSGSQVIALEDSEAFDQDAATMLNTNEPALLAEDPALGGGLDALDAGALDGGVGGFGDQDAFGAAAGGAAAGGVLAAGAMGGDESLAAASSMQAPISYDPPEAPYTMLQVIGLLTILGVLSLSGMLMVDVIRNIWAFDQTGSISTGLTDGLIGLLDLDK